MCSKSFEHNRVGDKFMTYYSMKQLQTITGKPPQTINRLMRKNDSLVELLPEHRKKLENGQVFYDDVILDWLKEYFQLETISSQEENKNDEKADTINNEEEKKKLSNETLIDELRSQINELEELVNTKDEIIQNKVNEISKLEKELNDKEAERLHFISLNSQLTALLAAEKQEKQLLLPPPKKTIGERIKAFFKKNN